MMMVTIMKEQKIKKLRWECLKTWVGLSWVGVFLIPSWRFGQALNKRNKRFSYYYYY